MNPLFLLGTTQEHRSWPKESGFRGQAGAMDCPEKGTTGPDAHFLRPPPKQEGSLRR